MQKRPGGAKTALIVAAAALVVIGVLLAAFLMTVRGSTRDGITLPGPLPSADPPTAQFSADDLFASVDRKNVQNVLAVLTRPEAYYQALSVSTLWSGGESSKTVELWRNGELQRAKLTDSSSVQYLLSNGSEVWIWYEGDETARQLRPDASVSFDDLLGIPTYEMLLELPEQEIREAGFVTLDDLDGASCLYLSTVSGDDAQEDRYWVDVNTQLLCKADTFSGNSQVYQLRQTEWSALSADDESLQNLFQLPNGTKVSTE